MSRFACPRVCLKHQRRQVQWSYRHAFASSARLSSISGARYVPPICGCPPLPHRCTAGSIRVSVAQKQWRGIAPSKREGGAQRRHSPIFAAAVSGRSHVLRPASELVDSKRTEGSRHVKSCFGFGGIDKSRYLVVDGEIPPRAM